MSFICLMGHDGEWFCVYLLFVYQFIVGLAVAAFLIGRSTHNVPDFPPAHLPNDLNLMLNWSCLTGGADG